MTTRSGPSATTAKGGWNAIVAIADVSFYVRPGSELDREARARGNSVYFPDRVVPMLPEELSADICSLKEGEDRAALACHLQDREGRELKSWRFTRAKVRDRRKHCLRGCAGGDRCGRARSGSRSSSPTCSMPPIEGPVPQALVETALKPLWACWRALVRGARRSATRSSSTCPSGGWCSTRRGGSSRSRRASGSTRTGWSRIIMIAANVAAAKALEAKKAPVMYRVHEPPSREKLVALKDYLEDLRRRVRARPGDQARHLQPHHRAGRRRRRPPGDHGAVLRTQMQACYAPERLGHFGLALGDLRAFHLADPPLCRPARPPRAGRAPISSARAGCRRARRAVRARSASRSRCSSAARWRPSARRSTAMSPPILADQVGQLVECRITGVQPFGFFATVEDLGGDGLVPRSDLGQRIFPLRRGRAGAGRRRERRDLSRRPAADAAAGRGQSGLGLAALRAARGQLRRARRGRARTGSAAAGRPTSATSRKRR